MSSPALNAPPGEATRDRLKAAAQRLFAERGVDGVTVRDIVAAAGARNGASLHYYFRTKEALIRELVVDGAMRIDLRRNAALDALEARVGTPDVADIVRLLIATSIEAEQGSDAAPGSDYLRFIVSLQVNHRQLFLDALENRWNAGYLRCLQHLQRLLTHLPAPLLNQRLIFMSLYLNATLAAREGAMAQPATSDKLWRSAWALDNLADSLCGLLTQAPSEATTERLPGRPLPHAASVPVSSSAAAAAPVQRMARRRPPAPSKSRPASSKP